MSGSEILGVISAIIQITGFCHDVQKRIRKRSGDRELSGAIVEECGRFIAEIDQTILSISTESPQALQTLRNRLVVIKTRIEGRRRRNPFMRGILALRLYAGSDKNDLLIAMHEYQTRAVQSILDHVGNNGIRNDIREFMISTTTALNALEQNVGESQNENADRIGRVIDGKLRTAIETFTVLNNEIQRSNRVLNSDLKAAVQACIKEEFALLRDDVAFVCSPNSVGQLDRGDLAIDLGTMKDYLERIVLGNGYPSDQDIVECVSDVVGTVTVFSPWIAAAMKNDLNIADMVSTELSGDTHVVKVSLLTSIIWSSLGQFPI